MLSGIMYTTQAHIEYAVRNPAYNTGTQINAVRNSAYNTGTQIRRCQEFCTQHRHTQINAVRNPAHNTDHAVRNPASGTDQTVGNNTYTIPGRYRRTNCQKLCIEYSKLCTEHTRTHSHSSAHRRPKHPDGSAETYRI